MNFEQFDHWFEHFCHVTFKHNMLDRFSRAFFLLDPMWLKNVIARQTLSVYKRKETSVQQVQLLILRLFMMIQICKGHIRQKFASFWGWKKQSLLSNLWNSVIFQMPGKHFLLLFNSETAVWFSAIIISQRLHCIYTSM